MLSPNFTPFPELATNRLLLRRLTVDDAAGVQALRSNPEVMRYINRPLTLSLEEAEKWVDVVTENLTRNEGITWCVCLKQNPAEHVGNIGLWRIEKENYRAEVGYMLEPSLQGKGLMFEALQAVTNYGFAGMGLHSIEARIDPRNGASARLLAKADFVQEGYFRENYFLDGGFADTAVYTLFTPHRRAANE